MLTKQNVSVSVADISKEHTEDDNSRILIDDMHKKTNIDDITDEAGIFCDFVQAICAEAGKNRFFDEFMEQHCKREIAIWPHQQETLQELRDDEAIFELMQEMLRDGFWRLRLR